MTRKKEYYNEIHPFLTSFDVDALHDYLLDHSNLPGRMANITLVSVFADSIGCDASLLAKWIETLLDWVSLDTSGDDPETLFVLSSLEALGAMYPESADSDKKKLAIIFAHAMNDDRWRVREIVTESYKRIGLKSYGEMMELFDAKLEDELTPREIRAMLATVAHPELLTTDEQLDYSMMIMKKAFDFYIDSRMNDFTKEDQLILKKGLSFAPSVIVSKNPHAGFAFLELLIQMHHTQLTPIMKENLKKKRLEKVDEARVTELLKQLEA